MKKSILVLLCIMLSVGVICSCSCARRDTFPIEQGTDLPQMADDTSPSPLGQFDETSAFGIVKSADDDGLVLEMQGKYFRFTWTEKAKRHYDKLGIALENEVGVTFEIAGDALIAHTVELVQAGEMN